MIKEKLKIISVVGARPNFIKIAPFCTEISKYPDVFEHLLVHTGQHYDVKLSQDFFDDLDIPAPDINLEVGSASHALQTAKIITSFEEVCFDQRPDWVVVVGDVNSTMASAIVASKMGIKIAHIEAGLRSFDRNMPEEINRLVADCLADLLFTPSPDADENLLKEGISSDKIVRVGNIMIDTLVANLDKIKKIDIYKNYGLDNNFIYVTLHRPSNVDQVDTLEPIVWQLINLSKFVSVVLPEHPRLKDRLIKFNLHDLLKTTVNIKLIDPVSYHESLSLIMSASLVITDSGGLQEETTFLGTPCLTLRPNTERPITITEGTNKLTKLEILIQDVKELLSIPRENFKNRIPKLWDGKTTRRIVDKFLSIFNERRV